MKNCLPLWLLALLLHWPSAARATAEPLAPSRSLADAINPDGTLRAGATGSFDGHDFTVHTAPDGRPVFRPAGVAATSSGQWQDGFGLPNGANGQVTALVASGNDVYVGGKFSAVNGTTAWRVAKWNGTAWSALGTGPANGLSGGDVLALAVGPGGEVYAGGTFTWASGSAAGRIARWNGTAWSPLGAGLNNAVNALAVATNGAVYAGGDFTQAGGRPANYVAK